MPKLHYFYPQNDGALADNRVGYMATRTAIALAQSGATIALWTGDKGDRFICDGVNGQWLDKMQELFGIRVDVWNGNPQGFIPAPWGWSLPVRRTYRDLGFADNMLPTDSDIDRIRRLSHRRTSILLASALHRFNPTLFCAPANECNELSFEQISDSIVIKQPWSSSGRGILFGNALTQSDLLRQARGMIRRQGSVIVQPLYNDVVNFSILFSYTDGRATMLGISVFDTDGRGSYTASMVAAPPQIEQYLRERGVDPDIARTDIFPDTLTALLGGAYTGLLGIDMMGIPCNGSMCYAVAEINLRTTMGHVALSLGNRFVTPGYCGRFTIERRNFDDMTPFCAADIPHTADFKIHDHQVAAGTIDLNPPECPFRFVLQQI